MEKTMMKNKCFSKFGNITIPCYTTNFYSIDEIVIYDKYNTHNYCIKKLVLYDIARDLPLYISKIYYSYYYAYYGNLCNSFPVLAIG
jgi:hypothetical protein